MQITSIIVPRKSMVNLRVGGFSNYRIVYIFVPNTVKQSRTVAGASLALMSLELMGLMEVNDGNRRQSGKIYRDLCFGL